jgi:RimJ/RimL family protein N-acetyltransferase
MTETETGKLVRLIRDNQPCIALTGAGVSTETPVYDSTMPKAIPFPRPPLQRESFVLRRLLRSDYEPLKAIRDHVETAAWVNTIAVPDGGSLIRISEANRRAGKLLHLVIADNSDDRVLGEILLFRRAAEAAETHIANIAYVVDPAERGRGIATGAVELLSEWAFAELGLERLQLTIHPDNHASRRVAEKAGYQFEGVLRSLVEIRGSRVDSTLYSRLPTDR